MFQPSKPHPLVLHLSVPLNTSGYTDSTTSLGSPFQCLTTLSVKKFILKSNPNVPWYNLRLFPFSSFVNYMGEEANPHFATTSFQGVVESTEFFPEPTLFQTKQPHLPQPLLQRLVLQTPDQLLYHRIIEWLVLEGTSRMPFSGHALGPQCLSCSEGPTPEHSTQGTALLELSVGRQPSSCICSLHYV